MTPRELLKRLKAIRTHPARDTDLGPVYCFHASTVDAIVAALERGQRIERAARRAVRDPQAFGVSYANAVELREALKPARQPRATAASRHADLLDEIVVSRGPGFAAKVAAAERKRKERKP